jgi:hypothetical protein
MKHTFIWAFLALVALFDLELEQMDVNTNFLHGELEEKIYYHNQKAMGLEAKKITCVC